jgi:hypothetical protein
VATPAAFAHLGIAGPRDPVTPTLDLGLGLPGSGGDRP